MLKEINYSFIPATYTSLLAVANVLGATGSGLENIKCGWHYTVKHEIFPVYRSVIVLRKEQRESEKGVTISASFFTLRPPSLVTKVTAPLPIVA